MLSDQLTASLPRREGRHGSRSRSLSRAAEGGYISQNLPALSAASSSSFEYGQSASLHGRKDSAESERATGDASYKTRIKKLENRLLHLGQPSDTDILDFSFDKETIFQHSISQGSLIPKRARHDSLSKSLSHSRSECPSNFQAPVKDLKWHREFSSTRGRMLSKSAGAIDGRRDPDLDGVAEAEGPQQVDWAEIRAVCQEDLIAACSSPSEHVSRRQNASSARESPSRTRSNSPKSRASPALLPPSAFPQDHRDSVVEALCVEVFTRSLKDLADDFTLSTSSPAFPYYYGCVHRMLVAFAKLMDDDGITDPAAIAMQPLTWLRSHLLSHPHDSDVGGKPASLPALSPAAYTYSKWLLSRLQLQKITQEEEAARNRYIASRTVNLELPLPGAWTTVYVYVCSTQEDMASERACIYNHVLPELRKRCAQRRLYFVLADLRHRVPRERLREIDEATTTLFLGEIDRCRPIFLGLLGERYGDMLDLLAVPGTRPFHWIKDWYAGRSFAELEITHGVLKRAEDMFGMFYFRRPGFENDVPSDLLATYRFNTDEEHHKVDALKQSIRASAFVHDGYACRWSATEEKVIGLEELAYRITEDLWSIINTQYGVEWAPLPSLAMESALQERWIESRSSILLGRSDILQDVLDYLDNDISTPLLLVAPHGYGKSAVLAHLCKEFRENKGGPEEEAGDKPIVYPILRPDRPFIYHFAGTTLGSRSVRRMLQHLVHSLVERFGLSATEDVPGDEELLARAFVRLLNKIGSKEKIAVVIDGVDHLYEAVHLPLLRWVPYTLPPNAKMILSCGPGVPLDQLRHRLPRPVEVDVPGIEVPVLQREILDRIMATYGTRLLYGGQNNQIAVILSKEDAHVPLFLRCVCEEVRVLAGSDPVEEVNINEAVPGLLFPDTLDQLFDYAIIRLEDLGFEVTRDVLLLLECSRHGLAESEILEILGDSVPFYYWARLIRSMRIYLTPPEESPDASSRFISPAFSLAVRRRYLSTEKAPHALTSSQAAREDHFEDAIAIVQRTYRRLCRYYLSKADPAGIDRWDGSHPKAIRDVVYYAIHAQMWHEVSRALTSLRFIEAKATAGFAHDLLQDDYIHALHAFSLARARPPTDRMDSIANANALFLSTNRRPGTTPSQQKTHAQAGTATGNSGVASTSHTATPPTTHRHGMPLSRSSSSAGATGMTGVGGTGSPSKYGSGTSTSMANYSSVASASASTSAPSGDTAPVATSGAPGRTGSIAAVPGDPPTDLLNGLPHVHSIHHGASSLVRSWSLAAIEKHRHTPFVLVSTYARFVRYCLDILVRSPQLVFQLASNYPDDSPVYAAAKALWDRGHEKRPWLQWINKRPPRDMCLETLRGHLGGVLCCAASVAGHMTASAGADKVIKVWDLQTATEVLSLHGHRGAVTSCTFAGATGRLLISASTDHLVKVWDVDLRRQLANLVGHTAEVTCCAATPDGTLVVSGSRDKNLMVWKLSADGGVATLEGHRGAILCCDVSFDGKYLASGDDNDLLLVWSPAGGTKPLMTLFGHRGAVTCCRFSPDASLIVTGSADHTLKVWRVNGGAQKANLMGHKSMVTGCDMNPGMDRICSTSDDKSLKIWSAESGALLMTLEGHLDTVTCCRFSHDGSFILTSSADTTLKAWCVPDGTLAPSHHTSTVYACAFDKDSKRVLTASADRTIKVWEVSSGNCLATMSGHSAWIRTCAFIGDSKVVSAGDANEIIIWSLQRNQQVMQLPGHTASITSCSVSKDASRLLTASADTTLRLWEVSTGRLLAALEGHTGEVLCCALGGDANGTKVISGSTDRRCIAWNMRVVYRGSLESATPTAVIEPVQAAFVEASGYSIPACAFSPDSTLAACSWEFKDVLVWNVSTGDRVRIISAHSNRVRAMTWSSRGWQLVTAGRDNAIYVWDAEHLYAQKMSFLIAAFDAQDESAVALSKDGQMVAIGGLCGRVSVLMQRFAGQELPASRLNKHHHQRAQHHHSPPSHNRKHT